MAVKFGNTWWGNEWLKSLDNIDYENRIPRGAVYAKNGKVEKLSIQRNTITAKVSGTRLRPYSVKMIIPPFFEEEVERLINELMKYPNVISQLLHRELDPTVLTIAQKCGLKIFPSKWNDLKMVCSCPDWAVPCKHIAAVIYMISREIDNNPFLVFQIHNVDLLAELEKRGLTVNEFVEEIKVPSIKDVIQTVSSPTQKTLEPQPAFHFNRIDFSQINDHSEALFLLLSNYPPFSPAYDFKETYVGEMHHLKKGIQSFLKKRLHLDDLFSLPEEVRPISTTDILTLTFNQEMEWKVNHDSYDTVSLAKALLQINPELLPDYHPTVIGLHQSLLCAIHLVGNAMIAPQIIKLKDKNYAIKWNPAYADRNILQMMEQLEEIIPTGTVRSQATEKGKPQAVAEQGQWVASLFLGLLIQQLSANKNSDFLFQFFFKGKEHPFTTIGEREAPGGIKAWTASFTVKDSNYRPVFFISEDEESGFNLHINIENCQQPDSAFTSLREVLTSERYADKRFDILNHFTLIAKMISGMNDYINSGASHPIHYTQSTFIPFLTEVIPALNMLDFKLFMPKSLQHLIHPKPTVKIQRKDTESGGFITLDSLFDFDWKVALGDDIVDVEEFIQMTHHSEGLIRFKGNYMYISPEELVKLKDAFEHNKQLSSIQLLQIALMDEYESAPILLTPEAKAILREITETKEVALPKQLNATLRPYQQRGFSWMYHNMRIGFGSILADDMGLGKTIQVITLILKLKEDQMLTDGKVLIVVPTGLLTNWQAEIERFAPSLTTFIYHGGSRQLKDFADDIMLTSYGVLRSDCAKIKKKKWTVMFIDEAQNIKNHDTAQSKAIKSIPAAMHIALSGTPVENRLTEYWSIMEFANKGYLGTLKEFKEKFAKPIQLYNDQTCSKRFRKITSPFMMRRMKSDKSIITDLPDKIELNDYASLKPEQASLYTATLEEAMAQIEGIRDADSQSMFKRQGLILQMILALKQICNHPAQFLKNGDIRSELSGKTEMLLERVETIVSNHEKVLIFTQFKEMGDMLVKFIAERTGKTPLFYHGGCSVKERQTMVERFQTDPTDHVFILSLKAAGTGLNLTAATHVIHYDLWWNPAVEAQATDRAYRIGQKQNVMVHRYITKNTFEEKIDEMIQQKKHLAEMTVASGENWLGKLSNKELREIFG